MPKQWSKTLSLKQLLKFVLCVLIAFHANSNAGARPFSPHVSASGPALSVNDQIILIVPGSTGDSRARLASSVLRRTSARYVVARKVTRRKWVVETPGGVKLLTVNRIDAKAEGGTVEGLAERWAQQITRALSEPALVISLKQKLIIVPTGEFRSLIVGGAARPDQITAASAASAVATSSYDASTRTLTIQGLKPGLVDITVEANDDAGGSDELNVPILVEDHAGAISTSANAYVTGAPASKELVLQAIRTALYRSISLHAGALLEIDDQPEVDGYLQSGGSINVPVTVRAVGADLIPVEQTIAVHVENDDALPAETAQTLFYSNDPETVRHPQTLFDAAIPLLNHPVRLVFHHQNVSHEPMIMRVELINVGQSSANIQIVRGLSGALPNPVDAGAVAGSQFYREWKADSGVLTSIPPQSRLELLVLKTSPSDVASGIVEIDQLTGVQHTLLMHVAAEPGDALEKDGMDALVKIPDPAKAALALLPLSSAYHASIASINYSDQIYSNPTVTISGSYTVGGTWMHLVIGTDSPIGQTTGRGALLGNYGVVYNVTIALSNPTTVRRQIEISFGSGAGDVSGVFGIIGGQTTTVNDLEPPNEQEITRVSLAPGAIQTLQLQTVPLSGSAYPAAIIARAL